MKTTHARHTNTLAALAAAFIITLGLPTATANAADFEGRIDMKMSNPSTKNESPTAMSIYVKTPKMRMEMTGTDDTKAKGKKGQGESMTITMITNTETGESYMLMPEQKMYMVTKDEKGGSAPVPTKDAGAYEPTGRTETILGHRAKEYASTGSGSYTEMWLAPGLGKFRMASGGQQNKKSSPKGWEKFLEDNELFPLKVTEYKKKGGDMIYQLEVTKIEQGTLANSLFEPPADYQKFDIGSMFSGLGDIMKENTQESAKESTKESAKEKAKSSIFDRLKKLGQ